MQKKQGYVIPQFTILIWETQMKELRAIGVSWEKNTEK